MPVTLPDDVAESLLAALATADATSLPPSFGDLHNILLSSARPYPPQQVQYVPSPPGRLSPLRFNHDSDNTPMEGDDEDDMQPKPPRCKRGATVLESEEEDSEEEQPLWHRRLELAALRLGRRRTTGLTITIPPLAAAGARPPRPSLLLVTMGVALEVVLVQSQS
ncbi:hypothetical protein DFH07DRAFT_970802 [Mycena maculata]|uniref:Uncharacterized protein n=1 Tax=Mycena maculata TaxID=230809 RepID=A0AAD7HRB3_9AGAR|nr:hypothetical protein DFH07DRAFT_970802 [Mycena maculata]